MIRKLARLVGMVVAGILLLAASAAWTLAADRLAIRGYDAVAYFTEGKPVPGSAEFERDWQGSRWRFASAAHRDMFVADPDRYAPQYAGYCALGVAIGKKFDVDPQVWRIVNGKLYLNYDQGGAKEMDKDVAGTIKKADQNWAMMQR
jgi:hypothetical protein